MRHFEPSRPLIHDPFKVAGKRKRSGLSAWPSRIHPPRRKEKLFSLSGKINIDLDWKKLEELELKGMKEREKLRKPRRHQRVD